MKDEPVQEAVTEEKRNTYGITRGARYYADKTLGGNHHD